MLAIVLSGGGAKGAYQQGVWKALRELNIKYDIVTGTSIGALNGLMMAQKEYYKCLKMWKNISFEKIYDDFEKTNNMKDMYKAYLDKIVNGGIDTSKIENLISLHYKPKKLYNSKVSFGIVAYNVSSKDAVYATTRNTRPDKLKQYILASITCFPVFKPTKIDTEILIDGGYYDNLPINLAIDLGATDIIAVDLRALGIKQKIKDKNINIRYIAPINKLDSFLNFDSNAAKRMIKLGYNDTMKSFGKCEGKYYTFKKNTIENLCKNYKKRIINISKKLDISSNNIKKLSSNLKEQEVMTNIIEDALEIFNISFYEIYGFKDINKKLFNELLNIESIGKELSLEQIKKILDRRVIVKYIYEKLEKCDKIDYIIFNVFSKEFTTAVYLLATRS